MTAAAPEPHPSREAVSPSSSRGPRARGGGSSEPRGLNSRLVLGSAPVGSLSLRADAPPPAAPYVTPPALAPPLLWGLGKGEAGSFLGAAFPGPAPYICSARGETEAALQRGGGRGDEVSSLDRILGSPGQSRLR